MRDFPPGWATDLAILEHSGSTVEDRGDHLLVRTPDNPGFHWGNCLIVRDENAVDDAGRWVQTFRSAFPEATWVAIGLIRMPNDQDAWAAGGPPIMAATDGSSSPRPPTRPDASTAASGSSQTPAALRRTASRRAEPRQRVSYRASSGQQPTPEGV
jgi:hypothetical protein